jgi:hypothetical protein
MGRIRFGAGTIPELTSPPKDKPGRPTGRGAASRRLAQASGCRARYAGPMGRPSAEKLARWASVGVMALYAVVAAVGAFDKGAWIDEGYTMVTTSGTLGEAFTRALRLESQPPLYFVVLNLWRRIDPSLGFARLLSIVIVGVAAFAVSRAVRAADPRSPPWLDPLVLAFVLANPFTFAYAAEARGYCIQLAVGAGAAWVLCSATARGRATRGHVLAFVVTGVLAVYTHYFAGLTVATLVALAWFRRLLSFRQLALIAALGAVIAAPLAFFASKHAAHVNVQGMPLVDSGLTVLGSLLMNAVPGVTRRWPLQLAWVVALALVCVVVVFRRRSGAPALSPAVSTLALAVLALALAFTGFGVVAGQTALLDRYLASLYAASWVGVVLLLGGLLGWRRAGLALVAVVALAVLRTGKIQALGHKSGDWREVGRWITERGSASRLLYVYPAEEALAGRVQLGRGFTVTGVPRDYDGAAPFTPADLVMEEPRVLSARLVEKTAHAPFWLNVMKDPVAPTGGKPELDAVERFVGTCCTVLARQEFGDATLRLVKLRPECLP